MSADMLLKSLIDNKTSVTKYYKTRHAAMQGSGNLTATLCARQKSDDWQK